MFIVLGSIAALDEGDIALLKTYVSIWQLLCFNPHLTEFA